MTDIVSPPAPIIPPLYPALGSPNFNDEAWAYGSSMPAVSQRHGELADNVHQNATASHERSVAAAQSAYDAEWHADRVALLNSLFLGALPGDPTTGKDGAPLVAGNFYQVIGGPIRSYNGAEWTQSIASMSGVSSLNGQSGALALTTLSDYGITDGARVETAVNVVTANAAAVAGRFYDCDTSAASFSLTLPAGPEVGDRVGVRDSKRAFASKPLTVLRNGQPIEGTNDDLLVNAFARGFFEFRGPTLGWIFCQG